MQLPTPRIPPKDIFILPINAFRRFDIRRAKIVDLRTATGRCDTIASARPSST
jgi:hypothetical protein